MEGDACGILIASVFTPIPQLLCYGIKQIGTLFASLSLVSSGRSRLMNTSVEIFSFDYIENLEEFIESKTRMIE
ncbi:hypothetical protein V6N13_141183 [Hibiscus sabdariffa]|uniref:Uncharacterized protein n=1 Tax=Hibiscus sabdariffa TaxID=183260 RepID=A0ABR2Q0P0_9ROSI